MVRVLKAAFFLVVLSLICSIGYGQAVTNQGNLNSILNQYGGVSSGRWFVLPDSLTAKLTTSLMRKYGLLAYDNTDSSVYAYDGLTWNKLAYSDDVPTIDTLDYYARLFPTVTSGTLPQTGGSIFLYNKVYARTSLNAPYTNVDGSFNTDGVIISPNSIGSYYPVTGNIATVIETQQDYTRLIINDSSGDYLSYIKSNPPAHDVAALMPIQGGVLVTDSTLSDSLGLLTLQAVTIKGNTTGENVEFRNYVNIGDSASYAGRTFIWNGTSITTGQGLSSPTTERFSYLTSTHFGATEDNNGVAGSTIIACTGCSSLPTNLSRIPTYTAGDIMVMEYGTNDIRFSPTQFNPAAIITWYDFVLADAVTKGWAMKDILIITPAYFYGNAQGWTPASYAAYQSRQDSFMATIKIAAQTAGTMYLDVWSETEPYGMTFLNADSLHVNATGHAFIANMLDSFLSQSIGVDADTNVVLNVYGNANVTGVPSRSADSVLGIRNGLLTKMATSGLPAPTLQAVTTVGNTTTKDIRINGNYLYATRGYMGDYITSDSTTNLYGLVVRKLMNNDPIPLNIGVRGSVNGSYTTTGFSRQAFGLYGTVSLESTNTGNWDEAGGAHPNFNGVGSIVTTNASSSGRINYATCYYGTMSNLGSATYRKTFLMDLTYASSTVTDWCGGISVQQATQGDSGNVFMMFTNTNERTPYRNNWALFTDFDVNYPSFHYGEFRIGDSTDLGTYALQVTGNGKFTDSVTSNTVMREAGIVSSILKTTSNGTHQAAVSGTDYEAPLTFTSPLSRSVNAISIPVATSSVNGYLSSADWIAFNAKQATGLSWNKVGNSITAGTDFLGTTNDADLPFRTNNTTKARLDSACACFVINEATLTPTASIEAKANSATNNVLFRGSNSIGLSYLTFGEGSTGGLGGVTMRGARNSSSGSAFTLIGNVASAGAIAGEILGAGGDITQLNNYPSTMLFRTGHWVGGNVVNDFVSNADGSNIQYNPTNANFMTTSVAVGGVTTFNATGSGTPAFVFSDPVSSTGTITGTAIISGSRQWVTGSGDPNSVVTGSPGDMYTNTAGGAGTTLYIKESGSATNTGWVAK